MSEPFPKVTYCVLCFNQQGYVLDALKAAADQVYPNLQILFSDDGSTDRSVETAESFVASYRGKHPIQIRRARVNRGIVEHINDVFEAADGEYVVLAAGDDVSAPERTIAGIRALRDVGGGAACYCGEWAFVGTASVDWNQFMLEVAVERGKPRVVSRDTIFAGRGGAAPGAVCTFHRDCVEKFGRLPAGLPFEDNALMMRAALLGSVVSVPQKLLARRYDPSSLGSTFLSDRKRSLSYRLRDQTEHLDCVNRDFEYAVKTRLVNSDDVAGLKQQLRRFVERELNRSFIHDRLGIKTSARQALNDVGILLAMGDWKRAAVYLRELFASRTGRK